MWFFIALYVANSCTIHSLNLYRTNVKAYIKFNYNILFNQYIISIIDKYPIYCVEKPLYIIFISGVVYDMTFSLFRSNHTAFA